MYWAWVVIKPSRKSADAMIFFIMSDFNYFGASIFIFLTPRPLMVRSPLDTIAGNDTAKLRFSRLRPDSGRRLRHGTCRDGTRRHPNFLYVMPLCMGFVICDL
jgi:hypothetical protein